MQKIPTLFVRDFERDNGRYVTDEPAPHCGWVFRGEGVATRKYDGTCVALLPARNGLVCTRDEQNPVDPEFQWFARREVKKGKPQPPGFCPVETDGATGKTMGWEPVDQSPFIKPFREACTGLFEPGTYELCGPKINGNPENLDRHVLIRHATAERVGPPPGEEFNPKDLVREAGAMGMEGIVWHHPDGRMAKLKARDIRAEAHAPA